MYTKSFPFKDFNNKPRNMTAHFNLTEREVFKLLGEFQEIFQWRDNIQGPPRDLGTEEVVRFYNNLETILLASWGVPSDDGLYFRKSGKYEFEESALFNAVMVEFVTDIDAATTFLDEIMPKDMEELARKADANVIKMGKQEGNDAELQAQIEELKAQLASRPTES